MKHDLKVLCGLHGVSLWKGTIICTHCGRVYQTSDDAALRFAPEVCTCGKRLMPERGGAPRSSYTAAAVCGACFTIIVARHHGRTPMLKAVL